MTAGMFFLSFGGLLILVAVLGGGFEIKQLKISHTTSKARVGAGVAGIFFLVLGTGMSANTAPTENKPGSPQGSTPSPMGGLEMRATSVPNDVQVKKHTPVPQSRVLTGNQTSRPASRNVVRTATSAPAEFVIFDKLGLEEIAMGERDQLSVKINGMPVGNLVVTPYSPLSELRISLPYGGSQQYVIEGRASLMSLGLEFPCYGAGTIDVTDGATFSVEGTIDDHGNCVGVLEPH